VSKNKRVKEYLRNLVLREIERQKEIDEVSTTGTAGIDGTGTGHYDTPQAFASGSEGGHPEPDVLGYKKVNERHSNADKHFWEMSKGMNTMEKKALGMTIDEFELSRTLYVFRTNKKAFDDQIKSNVTFLKAKHAKLENVNEVTGQEFVAINKIVTNLNNIQKSYQRATGIGDKELKDRKYNKHYETILAAKKSMISLLDILKTKQMLGEGRYHDWKRDESLSPKQKIGRSMREIRDALNELDKTVKMNLKLKTELNMSSQDYWKNTHKALTKISERLVKMANKVGNLK